MKMRELGSLIESRKGNGRVILDLGGSEMAGETASKGWDLGTAAAAATSGFRCQAASHTTVGCGREPEIGKLQDIIGDSVGASHGRILICTATSEIHLRYQVDHSTM